MKGLGRHIFGACLFVSLSYFAAARNDDHIDAVIAQEETYASGESFIRRRFGFSSVKFQSILPGTDDCAANASRCYRWLGVDAQGRLVTGVISMMPDVITA